MVHSILNFPLPLPMHPGSMDGSRLLAKFKLESEMIAVNKARTQYILLGNSEVAQCSTGASKLYEVSSPVYVANTRVSCEMSLF